MVISALFLLLVIILVRSDIELDLPGFVGALFALLPIGGFYVGYLMRKKWKKTEQEKARIEYQLRRQMTERPAQQAETGRGAADADAEKAAEVLAAANAAREAAANAAGSKSDGNISVPEEMLDDVTYIADSHHTAAGAWQQYDYLLASRGYGWDYMVSQAAYMAEADLDHIGTVTVSEMANMPETELISEYQANGNRIAAMPALKTERGVLSIGGMSRTLQFSPVKIVWFNQTKMLRIFTIPDDEGLLLRYAETMIRRTFNTPDAMKLAKLVPGAKQPEPTMH